MTVSGRQSSHHWHGPSVMLPEVVGRVCVCMYLHQAQTPEKTIKERYSMHGD